MNNKFKNIFTVTGKRLGLLMFIFLFLFNTIGYYIFILSAQYQHKTQQFADLENKKTKYHTLILKFPVTSENNISGFSRINEKEIQYQNEMYDIVKTESRNDSVYFYVVKDDYENSLFESLEEQLEEFALEKNKLPKKDSKPDVLKNFLKDYIPDHSKKQNLLVESNFSIYFVEKPDLYLSAIISLPDIPPEVFNF